MARSRYKISTRAKECAMGGTSFEVGDRVHSLVSFSDENGYERRDLCLSCWNTQKRPEEGSRNPEGYWATIVPEKLDASQKPMSQREKALAILREAVASGQLAQQKLAFVLALYLERRGEILRRKAMDDKLGKKECYEVPETGEVITVEWINPSIIEVDAVQSFLEKELVG